MRQQQHRPWIYTLQFLDKMAWRWKYKPRVCVRACDIHSLFMKQGQVCRRELNVALFCPLNQHPCLKLYVLNQRTSCEPATHSLLVCFLLRYRIAGKLAISLTSSDIMKQLVSVTVCVFMCGFSGGIYPLNSQVTSPLYWRKRVTIILA